MTFPFLRAALVALAAALGAGGAAARQLMDLAYGPAERQKLDVYLPDRSAPGGAPILVMVHGGAWMFGKKTAPGVVGAKRERWNGEGWIFVSVDNRLLPEADALTQADDVAAALAFVQKQAPGWGGDPKRLVLMGHSAGAHLVSLVDVATDLAARAGVQPWLATVSLDGGALDLANLMSRPHARFYDRVFGADPAFWRQVSPADRVQPGAPPLLLVCSSTRRGDPCAENQRFAERARAQGVSARVLPQALSHAEINADLGKPGPYTDAVAAFIDEVMTRGNPR